MDQSKFCVVPVVDCFSVQYRWKIIFKKGEQKLSQANHTQHILLYKNGKLALKCTAKLIYL